MQVCIAGFFLSISLCLSALDDAQSIREQLILLRATHGSHDHIERHMPLITRYVKTVNLNVPSLSRDQTIKFGGSPLHNVVRAGHLGATQLLLGHGVYATRACETKPGQYNTPLHEAVRTRDKKGDYVGVTQLLCNVCVNPNTGGEKNKYIPLTPLMVLVLQRSNNEKLLKALLAFDALDLNKRSGIKKQTALFMAAERGNAMVIKYLCHAGARLDTVDSYSFTPLSKAIMNNYMLAANMLLQFGASPYAGKQNAVECILIQIHKNRKNAIAKRRCRELLSDALLAAHFLDASKKEQLRAPLLKFRYLYQIYIYAEQSAGLRYRMFVQKEKNNVVEYQHC